MQNTNRKCSNSFLFSWNINDDLYIFAVKARLSLFPTNFTLYLWDGQKNPHCSLGCFHTESMTHVLNGCIHHFSNLYSSRHDPIVEMIASFLKESDRTHIDKHSSTVFPSLADKPDIHVIDHLLKSAFLSKLRFMIYIWNICKMQKLKVTSRWSIVEQRMFTVQKC